MNTSWKSWLAVALLMCLLLAPFAKGAVTCSDVLSDLSPCVGYLQTGTGKPTSSCCNGATKLAASAKSTADRQAVCSCLMGVVSTVQPKESAAKALPGACGLQLGFPISTKADCST
eukprot:Gb_23000 [translate_table: standard]